MTADEIHRFLPRTASRPQVDAALAGLGRQHRVEAADAFSVLPGRRGLAARRRRCEERAAPVWRDARRHARLLALVPWVRMVAVSGSLALSAVTDDADIDLVIVAASGRVWLSRAASLALGRVSGGEICPNYILADSELVLGDRDLYTAHELVQLVPLVGGDTYRELLARNRWYREFLPNHPGHTGRRPTPALRIRGRFPPLTHLESWELRRKTERLRRTAGPETRFDAAVCKGHVDAHRARFWAAFAARLQALETAR